MQRFRTVWRWLMGHISREVPVEDALCEFDCRKPQCFEGEWENCLRRMRRAAGELIPLKTPDGNS